ncbi:hypothetical protein GQ55_3G373500 [Panicum hallii var. hallii]|uniref:Uncharacterized protein n=1 Tax=Panicum hallii var. hallii TaxID=1504633 RepID=A0A2T7EG92_9POAL|nr:hypothetical protein GQ55_3G373500 [Panicum hallii var. hallii]
MASDAEAARGVEGTGPRPVHRRLKHRGGDGRNKQERWGSAAGCGWGRWPWGQVALVEGDGGGLRKMCGSGN